MRVQKQLENEIERVKMAVTQYRENNNQTKTKRASKLGKLYREQE